MLGFHSTKLSTNVAIPLKPICFWAQSTNPDFTRDYPLGKSIALLVHAIRGTLVTYFFRGFWTFCSSRKLQYWLNMFPELRRMSAKISEEFALLRLKLYVYYLCNRSKRSSLTLKRPCLTFNSIIKQMNDWWPDVNNISNRITF